jgi:hypothetical protein
VALLVEDWLSLPEFLVDIRDEPEWEAVTLYKVMVLFMEGWMLLDDSA